MISLKEEEYLTIDHDSFVRSIRNFHHDIDTTDSACFGVAGVVKSNGVTRTNFTWEIDVKTLESILNIKRILPINDMQANACGLSALDDTDYKVLKIGVK